MDAKPSLREVIIACEFAAKSVVGSHANTNGFVNHLAGNHSENCRVLGLMPHQENLIDPLVGGTDGRGLFEPGSLGSAAEFHAFLEIGEPPLFIALG